MDVVHIILCITGFCLGLRMVSDDDKLLHPVRAYLIGSKVPLYISKPLLLCESCMASVWGSLVFWSIVYLQGQPIELMLFGKWILSCFAASFINGFIWALYELVRKY